MAVRDWFIIGPRLSAEKGAALAAGAGAGNEGVFFSAKSLASFPVASLAVAFLWKGYNHFWPSANDVVVLYIALAIGFLVFLISISEPDARPRGAIKWVIAVAIAILNSFFLAASALGLLTDIL